MMRLLFVIQLAEVGNEVDPEGAPSPKVNVPEYWARAAGRRVQQRRRSEASSLAVLDERRFFIIGKKMKIRAGRRWELKLIWVRM